ncbi:MAG: M56 family metallopeptidase [Phycisphaerae bacterium]|jgi:beta-lactamase regulating signal transducer with metallopeptidase domain
MEYVKNFTDHLVRQSWQIAVLFLIVAVGSFLLRNKSSHWRYLLWCVILAKCLLPPVMTFKAAVLPFDAKETPSIKLGAKYEEPRQSIDGANLQRESGVENRELNNQNSNEPRQSVGGANRPHYAVIDYVKEHFYIFVFAVWGSGAIVFLIVAGVRAFLLNRWILRHRQLPGEDVLGEIEKLKSTVSSEFLGRIWVADKITQPFVWGLWRGCAYLPAGSKNSADVIMHELAHIMRLDAFVNLLQIFAQAIFWFHPFVWIANNRIRAEREKSCDEIAIARLNISPRSYSSAVVDVLVREYQARKALPSLAVAGPVKNIEERIKTIMAQGKKFYSRPTAAAVITVLVLAAICVPTTIAITKAEEPQRHKGTKNVATENTHSASSGQAEIEKTKQGDFKAMLSNGTTVELIGVCEHPSEGKQWWRADGTVLTKAPYKWYDTEPKETTFKGYEFAAGIYGGTDVEVVWNMPIKNKLVSIGLDRNDSTGYIGEMAAAAIQSNEDLITMSVRIGIAAGDWKTSFVYDGKETAQKECGTGNVIFSDAYKIGDGVQITVSDTIIGSAHRIVAIDKAGKMYKEQMTDRGLKGIQSLSGEELRQTTVYFPKLKQNNVKEFQFQTRPYEWVEFKNVSLKPGVKTDVQIEVEKDASEKSALNTKNTISFHHDISIRDALRFLGEKYKQNIIPSDKVNGRVTARTLYDVTFEETLKAILGTNKYIIDGNFIRVYTAEEYKDLPPNLKTDAQIEKVAEPQRHEDTKKINANEAGKIENVDLYVEDFDIRPYEVGGLYTVTAKIGNHGIVDAPVFSMNFFKGDPKENLNLHGKPQSGSYGAGPIKPGEFWNEQSSPFALTRGENTLSVFLDINNKIAETNELNNSATMRVLFKNGKIIKKTAGKTGG